MIVEFTLHNGQPIAVNTDHVLYARCDPSKMGLTMIVMQLIPVQKGMQGLSIVEHTVDVKESYSEVIARLEGKPMLDLGASGRAN